MSPAGRRLAVLAITACTLAYVAVVGIQQRRQLCPSSTAAGQYPYLDNARTWAESPAGSYWGDRNRHPLYPILMSLAHDKDWLTFYERAGALSVIIAVTLTLAIAGTAVVVLGAGWLAAFVIACAGVFVIAPRAGIIQAELIFYVLLMLSWMCGGSWIAGGGNRAAAAGGGTLGLAFLAKASALPMLLLIPLLRAAWLVIDLLRKRHGQGKAVAVEMSMFLGVFFLITGPLLLDNVSKFGTPFYNVNSRYFMWFDNWQEASEFAAGRHLDKSPAAIPADSTPGPRWYLERHGLRGALRRLGSGMATAAWWIIVHPLFKYIAALGLGVLLVRLRRGRSAGEERSLWRGHGILLAAMWLVYFPAYAWYVPVAFGDRFVISLLLPTLLLAAMAMRSKFPLYGAAHHQQAHRPLRGGATLLAVGCLLIAVEAGTTGYARATQPDAHFVRFYFNESREREKAGDVETALRGYRGVLDLQPDHAPSALAAGMLLLRRGQVDDARGMLERATRSAPGNAEAWNGLGGAWLATDAGHGSRVALIQAAESFAMAVSCNSDMGVAWFNLGYAYIGLGRSDLAARVADRVLDRLAPALAARLRRMLPPPGETGPGGAEDGAGPAEAVRMPVPIPTGLMESG